MAQGSSAIQPSTTAFATASLTLLRPTLLACLEAANGRLLLHGGVGWHAAGTKTHDWGWSLFAMAMETQRSSKQAVPSTSSLPPSRAMEGFAALVQWGCRGEVVALAGGGGVWL